MRIIRGKYGRRRFDVPTNITARPTTDFARENIFNVIENLVDIEDARVLDLFAGTGAVSFEFLSRGAASVTAVEKAATQYNFIGKVASLLNDPNIHVIRADVHPYLASLSAAGKSDMPKFDIVFADPPYNLPDFAEIAETIVTAPIYNPGALTIIEHSKAYSFDHLEGFIDHRTYGSVNFSLFSH